MGGNGATGVLDASQPVWLIIASFTAIAWYNCIELNVMIWTRFKKYSGLYFWSLLASSWGIIIHALSCLAKFFEVWRNAYICITFLTIGWYLMVTGQSLVLYSRLHVVMRDIHNVRWVLIMIIVDFFLFHVTTTILTFLANSPLTHTFAFPFSVMEKVQITAFCIQESIISGLYIYYSWRILKTSTIFQQSRSHRIMRNLIIVNALIISMDLTLLGIGFAGQYAIEATYKSALYSIKLKLEFAVLNQIVKLVRRNPDSTITNNISHDHGSPKTGRRSQRPTYIQVDEPSNTYSVSASAWPTSTLRERHLKEYVMKTMDVEVTILGLSGKAESAPSHLHTISGSGLVGKGKGEMPIRASNSQFN